MDSASLLSDASWTPLSPAEKKLLLKTWKLVEPMKQQLGCNIYDMIFSQCPETLKLFPYMKYDKKEKRCTEFTFQALRFVQVIESVVQAIDNLDAMNPVLDNLGRRHGKLEFRSYYWSVFLEACIFQLRRLLEGSRKFDNATINEAIILWRVLLNGLLGKIKTGYDADIAKRLAALPLGDSRRVSLPSLASRNSDGISSLAEDVSKNSSAHHCQTSIDEHLPL